MFYGNFAPRLDDKGRLILPAKYRAKLAEGLVITRGQEHCLYIYPEVDFYKAAQQAIEAPMDDKDARDYKRMLLSAASDQVPDKQGRITIPADLRDYAGLDRDVAVVGAGPVLEVWDSQRWDDYRTALEPKFASISVSREVIPSSNA